MFSHIVVFWTHPELPGAAEAIIAAAEEHIRPIPEVKGFHVGRMVPSERPVVDSSFAVALNLIFDSKEDEAAYQVHPGHQTFLKIASINWQQVRIYDFA
jgi:hypothetical protein